MLNFVVLVLIKFHVRLKEMSAPLIWIPERYNKLTKTERSYALFPGCVVNCSL